MNNIDHSVAPVKGKIKIAKAIKTTTVGEKFADLGVVLPDDLAAKVYQPTHAVLCAVTSAYAASTVKQLMFDTKAPTPSFLTSKQKAFSAQWWVYLTEEMRGGPDANDKSLRNALNLAARQSFDAVSYKVMTGNELPEAKDGFRHNAMQVLRKATGHGDAAVFLYRIRYWWPRAQIIAHGKRWIAKTHKQWAEELGMEERGFRTAYAHLIKLDLIEARKAIFNGITMNHIRPTDAAEKLFRATGDEGTN